MKLKLLVIAILGVQFVGCASQPVSQSTSLSHKVYHGYEQLVSKESYAYNGKMSLELDGQLNKPSPAKEEVISNPQSNVQRQQVLDKSLILSPQLATQQKNWFKDDLVKLSTQTPEHQPKVSNMLQTLLKRFYYSYDGVVDLRRGQMSFNAKMGYESRNAQAWISFPMALDLKNSMVYADISALSPLLTDPQYDGRYVSFNYKELLEKSGINQRPALEFLRDLMLINAALAKDSDYQKMPLSAEDQQQGGVERIRYNGQYADIMAQYYLYFYLNQPYLTSTIANVKDQDALEHLNPLQMALQGSLSPHSIEQQLSKALEQQSSGDAAEAASTRLERLIDALYEERVGDDDEHSAEVYASEAVVAAEEAVAAAEDAVDAAAIATSAADGEVYSADEVEYTDDAIAVDATAAAENPDAIYSEDEVAREQILNRFEKYQQKDKLVSALDVKAIVTKEPEAYQELVNIIKTELNETKLMESSQYHSDLTFDRQGRIVRNELSISIEDIEVLGVQKLTAKMVANIGQYGQAQVNQQDLKNAVSFSQAANENTALNLGKLLDEKIAKPAVTDEWSLEQRYQQLAEQLLAQNVNFIDAYTAVYRYAYILNGEDVTDPDFSIKELNNTGRWNAIYYSRENNLGATAAELQEFEDSPDDWQHYDDPLSEEIWGVFKALMADQHYNKAYQKLSSQYKDDAALFTALYLEIETQNEQKNVEGRTVEFPESFLEFANVLGQIAAEDLKTQKVDPKKLENLSVAQLEWFDVEIYEAVYRQLLKR